MDTAKLRAFWWKQQGLDGSLQGATPAEVLERTGWARSVGGAGPYLTLFSRAGISREAADAAAAKLQIHELPAARSCTYVVPASDFAVALTLAQGGADEAQMKTARKLGVTDKEIDKLRDKIMSVLGKTPMLPDELRDAVGGAARNLGEEGKKKGVTTTLPLALGYLQSSGEIRRVPVNGRLDQQRYKYVAWKPNPLEKCKLGKDEAMVELAKKYFRWIGPASLAEFQWFSGLGVKAAKAATDELGLVPMEAGSEQLLFPDDREKLEKYVKPKAAAYSLIGNLDGLSLLRRDLKSLIDEGDLGRSVYVEKGAQLITQLSDLPSHAIVDRGRVAGLWEFDTESSGIAWMTFGKKDKAMTEAVSRMEKYVRDDLGDARSFSLDSPKSRAPRVAALRAAG